MLTELSENCSFCMAKRHCHSSVYYNYILVFRFRSVNRVPLLMCSGQYALVVCESAKTSKKDRTHGNTCKFACNSIAFSAAELHSHHIQD